MIAEAFADGPSENARGPRCSVGKILATATPEDADVLRAVLQDPAWSTSRISEQLRSVGVRAAEQSIARHRRGLCLCESLGMS